MQYLEIERFTVLGLQKIRICKEGLSPDSMNQDYYSNEVTYMPPQGSDDPDDNQIILYLDYLESPCTTGNTTFTLQVENTGDVASEVKDTVFIIQRQ